MIRYREIQPSPWLRPFVDQFWILEHDGADLAPQRVVPDGRSELILNGSRPFQYLQSGEWQNQPRCFLAGQIDGPLLLRATGPARILGIRFQPHGAARVLAPPMHELSGRFTPVEEISPSLAAHLHRALESRDPIAPLEAALSLADSLSRPSDLLVEEAVHRIARERGASDLAAIARDLGLSIRQLERRFNTSVGLPPKLFCRIQRFNNFLRIHEHQSCNFVEAALDSGYYDQAHLIRDCKDLAGHTPAILLAEEADFARHFYLRSAMSHSSNTGKRDPV